MVINKSHLLGQIKNAVLAVAPHATVILFGSYARGDNSEDSDVDLLVLLDKEKITYEDETKIARPLYMLEINTGISISPLIYSKHFWESQHKVTPFYENVIREGIAL
jgi:predicted nucleotidyltransferase